METKISHISENPDENTVGLQQCKLLKKYVELIKDEECTNVYEIKTGGRRENETRMIFWRWSEIFSIKMQK